MRMSKLRVLAIALIKNAKGQALMHRGYDSKIKQHFYRPLGGGVDFGEKSKSALKREFMEELGLKIQVKKLLTVFESIFTYSAKEKHEIVFLYEANFLSASDIKKEYNIIEDDEVSGIAVWRSLKEIQKEKAPLYPAGLEKYL